MLDDIVRRHSAEGELYQRPEAEVFIYVLVDHVAAMKSMDASMNPFQRRTGWEA